MPVVAVGDVMLHVQELGAGVPGRPTVVMLHGLLLGSLASWYFTCAPALSRTHRVVLFDLRGHGRSERAATGYGVRRLARDLEALTDRLCAEEPLALVGHSYGGLVALELALSRPDRVLRLAVVEAPLPPSGFADLTTFLSLGPERMADVLPAPLRQAVARPGRQAARLLESLRFLAYETTLLEDVRREPDVPDERLSRLACPMLCAYGDRSSCRPAGERLARVVPRAELRILPGGHYLHLDAPDALSAALVEHLNA